MTNINELSQRHIRPSEALLDAMTFMRIASQILGEGDVSNDYASEISWMLGSLKKRLEPVMDLVERLETAGAIDISPEVFKADLSLMVDIEASQAKLDKIRKEVKA